MPHISYFTFDGLIRRAYGVAVVTHGGPIAALLLALGMDEATLERHRVYDHRNPLPTAGAWLATRDGEDQSWNLKLIYPRPD